MKDVKTYINENKTTMYYRMILTYNFSDDDTRSSFEELVEELGFVEAEDQSTYVLPYVINKKSKDVTEPIVEWSENEDIFISEDDFVQLFYILKDTANGGKTKIASKYLSYDADSDGLS